MSDEPSSSSSPPPPLPPQTSLPDAPCCRACNQPWISSDTPVRMRGDAYHHACLVCEDCSKPVGSNMYALSSKYDGNGSNGAQEHVMILCEQHYYTHLGLICQQCHEPILEPVDPRFLYHPQCLQCPDCVTHDNASSFEYDGQVYCRYHFSLRNDTHCSGCNMAILKQFVEQQNAPKSKWHLTCYMVQKSWNVRLADFDVSKCDYDQVTPGALRKLQVSFEKTLDRIWTDLSAFEESAAACISDMLLNFAAGATVESLRMVSQFVSHVQVLFAALDALDTTPLTIETHNRTSISCAHESKALSTHIIQLLQWLAHPAAPPSKQDSHAIVAQEVLALVTGMAQSLKSLIRIGLIESLQLESHQRGTIARFLEALLPLEKKRVWIAGRYWFKDEPIPLASEQTISAIDQCQYCKCAIEDECLRRGPLKWHLACFTCTLCKEPLASNLSRACLVQSTHDNDDKTLSTLLVCTHCYTQQGGQYDQQTPSSQAHLFIHTTRLEQHLDLVRSSLTQYFYMIAGRVPGGAGGVSGSARAAATGVAASAAAVDIIEQHDINASARKSTRRTSSFFHLMIDRPRRLPTTMRRSVTLLEKTPFHRRLGNNIRRALSTEYTRSPYSSFFLDGRKRAATAEVVATDSAFGQHVCNDTDDDESSLARLTEAQDILARYLAVVHLQRLLPERHTLNDLVSLILYDTHRQSLWKKLKGRVMVVTSRHQQDNRCKTFGVPLTDKTKDTGRRQGRLLDQQHRAMLLDRIPPTMARYFAPTASVPEFVQTCILTLLGMDMSVEGVFRKNGNIRELNATRQAVDRGDPVDLRRCSPIQLCALLKRYLHDLPEPLLTFKLYDLWIASTRMDSESKCKAALHLTCCMLPKTHRDTMQLLFLFLHWVASWHDSNRMDITNLARVIAPTILYAPSSITSPSSSTVLLSPQPQQSLTSERQQMARDEIRVVEMLILHQQEFCKIPSHIASMVHDPAIVDRATTASMSPKQAIKSLASSL